MDDTFKESVIEKIEQIERQVNSLSGSIVVEDEIRQQQKNLFEGIAALKAGLSQLSENINLALSVFSQIKDLSGSLEHYSRALENPVEKQEYHIHHFCWPLEVAVGIFLLLVLAVSTLYINH